MSLAEPRRDDDPSLGQVVSRLAPGPLEVAVAPSGVLDRPLRGVSVHDDLLELPAADGHVLLAVGVDSKAERVLEIIGHAAGRGYVAVVLHADQPLPERVALAAQKLGIAVLTALTDVPWVHLASLLRVGITTSARDDEVAGVRLGDLFGFCNSLAADIGGAVTLEDPQSHVLAYSSVNDEVDEPRKETILGRQVPERYMRLLQQRGVFRQLLRGDEVVHMAAIPEVRLSRRLAVSVRAGGELLGSIWVAETGQPLVEGAEAILREAALTAALHIMRHRTGLQSESYLRRSMVRDLLVGTAADIAAVRLGLNPAATCAVLGFETVGGRGPSNRLLPVVELYCSTFHRAALTIDVGPRVYVVLTELTVEPRGLRRLAPDVTRRATATLQAQVFGAIGSVVASVDQVVASRDEVDRIMRVLLRLQTQRTVADLNDVRAQANLLEVLDLLKERPHLQDGPLKHLTDDGRNKNSQLVATVRAYLVHFGDVPAAARSLHVHPNTFRYRLQRATEVMGGVLDDPDARLMLWLQARLGL
jgi:hypothetical protein